MTIRSLRMSDFTSVSMTPSIRDWWDTVPAVPGWYAIETTAPVSALTSVSLPLEEGRHYRIPDRIRAAQFLLKNDAAIVPRIDGAPYIVYSGEHGNLKSRAREHTHGNKGTGCLCLSQYQAICGYQWTFYFRTCESHVHGSGGNKMLRRYLEQKWRAEHGWPVLCAE